jgi:hypothetical protein
VSCFGELQGRVTAHATVLALILHSRRRRTRENSQGKFCLGHGKRRSRLLLAVDGPPPAPQKSRDQLFTDPGSVRAEPARRIMPSVSNAGDVPQPDGTPPTQRSVSLFGPIRNLSGLQPWRNTFIHHGRGRCIFLLLDCSLSPLPSWAFASARADCRRTSTGRPTCCSLTGPTGRAGAFALMTRSLVVPVREIHTRPASLTESESRKI